MTALLVIAATSVALLAAAFAFARTGAGHSVLAPGAEWARGLVRQDASTPTPGGFSARSFVDGDVTYPYQIFFPRDYDSTRRWPVIVALHGTGEMGSDNERQLGVGLAPYVRAHAATFPAVAIFPQVPRKRLAPHNYAPVRRLLERAFKEVNADPSRLYLTGHSSGGVMLYNVVMAEPGRFAAVVPAATAVTLIEGLDRRKIVPKPEAFAVTARALRGAPVWIFHGTKDGMVPVSEAREAVKGLQDAGAQVRYTEIADGPHGIWERVFTTPEFWPWLFSQHR